MRDTSRMATPAGNSGSRGSGLRVSDADRERVSELLRQHFSAGRLSDDELAERIEEAYGARTSAELEALTEDLPSARQRGRRRRSGLETSVRIHATIFLVVNLMLIAIWAASGGGYFWPIWPILGWGIGLGCHAAPLLAHRGHPPALREADVRRGSHRRQRDLAARSGVDEVASSVASEQPSLRAAAAPDGTVTILFSDIEGSTAL